MGILKRFLIIVLASIILAMGPASCYLDAYDEVHAASIVESGFMYVVEFCLAQMGLGVKSAGELSTFSHSFKNYVEFMASDTTLTSKMSTTFLTSAALFKDTTSFMVGKVLLSPQVAAIYECLKLFVSQVANKTIAESPYSVAATASPQVTNGPALSSSFLRGQAISWFGADMDFKTWTGTIDADYSQSPFSVSTIGEKLWASDRAKTILFSYARYLPWAKPVALVHTSGSNSYSVLFLDQTQGRDIFSLNDHLTTVLCYGYSARPDISVGNTAQQPVYSYADAPNPVSVRVHNTLPVFTTQESAISFFEKIALKNDIHGSTVDLSQKTYAKDLPVASTSAITDAIAKAIVDGNLATKDDIDKAVDQVTFKVIDGGAKPDPPPDQGDQGGGTATVLGMLTAILNKLTQGFDSFTTSLGSKIDSFKQTAATQATSLISALKLNFQTISDDITRLWDKWIPGILTALNDLRTFTFNLPALIFDKFTTILGSIKDAVSNGWASLGASVASFKDTFVSTIGVASKAHQESLDRMAADVKKIKDSKQAEDLKTTQELTPAQVKDSGVLGIGLETVFPFCIPFDLVHAISILSMDGQAPHFEYDFKVPSINYSYHFVIDLAQFNSLAKIFRTFQVLLFIFGLIIATRSLIKG